MPDAIYKMKNLIRRSGRERERERGEREKRVGSDVSNCLRYK